LGKKFKEKEGRLKMKIHEKNFKKSEVKKVRKKK